jgi:hypothetical protein
LGQIRCRLQLQWNRDLSPVRAWSLLRTTRSSRASGAAAHGEGKSTPGRVQLLSAICGGSLASADFGGARRELLRTGDEVVAHTPVDTYGS